MEALKVFSYLGYLYSYTAVIRKLSSFTEKR